MGALWRAGLGRLGLRFSSQTALLSTLQLAASGLNDADVCRDSIPKFDLNDVSNCEFGYRYCKRLAVAISSY